MITVLQKPDAIQLSGNPMDFEVLASRADGSPAVSAGGSRARLSGLAGAGLPSGTTVTLSWTTPEGATRTVTFSTSGASASVYEIPAYVSGALSVYWSNLAAAIGSNQEVSPFFTLTAGQNANGTFGITAIARSNDPAWDIQWGPSGSSSFTVQNSLPGNADLGYRIRVSVFMQLAGTFQLIGEFGGPPNAQSRYSFDIGRMLHSAIRDQLPTPGLPSFAATAPIPGANVFPYYVRISEFTSANGYGASVLVDGLSAFGGRLGGALQGVNFIANVTPPNSWLCARPDRRLVGRNEPVFLSYVKTGSGTASVALQVEEFDQEGTGTLRTMFSGTIVNGQNAMTFPVGVAALGIASDTMYYRVRVTGLNNPWRTFIVDTRSYESERYIGYLNSFFLPEVFRCVGSISHSMDANYQTYTRVRPLNGGRTEPGKGNWSTETTEDYVFATGYKPRAEISALLRELVESPRVYDYRATGSIPLLPTGKNFSFGSTNQSLFAANLSFELAELEKGSAFGAIGDTVGPGTDTGGGVIDPVDPEPGTGGDLFDYWKSPDNSNWESPDGTPWYVQ